MHEWEIERVRQCDSERECESDVWAQTWKQKLFSMSRVSEWKSERVWDSKRVWVWVWESDFWAQTWKQKLFSMSSFVGSQLLSDVQTFFSDRPCFVYFCVFIFVINDQNTKKPHATVGLDVTNVTWPYPGPITIVQYYIRNQWSLGEEKGAVRKGGSSHPSLRHRKMK